MKLLEILEPDFSFSDERGVLTQITHSPYAQTNSVFSRKGQTRGNYHYHKFAKEIFFVVSGKLKVRLNFEDVYEEYQFRTGDMFQINENVKHCFDYEEDTYLVVFYTSPIEMEDGNKDIFQE